ncbi:MAG: NifU N-terminal domain-containing protein [Flavobacteriaceae bacterium]|nr:NifU N-terminal domain-containing protein [Flavobacteriaceae bacterium]
MKKYLIVAKESEDGLWAQFTMNEPLGPKDVKIYENIDAADKAPIVQQLFYLPFVKSVRLAQQSLFVERFNIVEWKEVIEEVSIQLENYLNEGGIVIEATEGEKIPITIYAESTPNPAAMKFVANKPLVINSIEFKKVEDSQKAPMAKALFQFPFVKEIFFDANYVSILKSETTDWESVVMELREFIKNYLSSGKTIVEEDLDLPTQENTIERMPLSAVEEEIVSILNEYVKPAVASDGGNIAFEHYDADQKIVHVLLQGACSGCPSSTFTLKNGIENILKEMLPQKVNAVEAING